MTEGLTVAGQAERLCVSEADIRAVIVDYLQYDLHDDTLPAEVVDELDNVLNPRCCRTVPGLYGYTGEDDTMDKPYGLDALRYCPDCPPGARTTYAKAGDEIVLHTMNDCSRIRRDHILSALTDEDRVWLREHGWNGR